MALFDLIKHIQGTDQRQIALFELHGEQQVAFQIRGIEHIDYGINLSGFQFVGHVSLFRTESTKRVSAGQVHKTNLSSLKLNTADDTAHRNTTVVSGAFMPAAGCVEQRCFSAVGVTDECQGHHIVTVFKG